jgi:hypothetical protein
LWGGGGGFLGLGRERGKVGRRVGWKDSKNE